jgi:manganese oxidase
MANESRSLLGWFSLMFSMVAMGWALFALRSEQGISAAQALPEVAVTLSEFTITPKEISLPAEGGVMRVTNTGTSVHNLSIPQLGLNTGDIQPGASTTVKVAHRAPGAYAVNCDIVGHIANGMTASLMIGGGKGPGEAADTAMPWHEMDRHMADVAGEFPAATTGHGGDPLPPTVLADGTKEFDLEAKIVDWEVSPGKTVRAWAYNGVVPAPEIHVEVGDRVRIVLKNSLPESTSLHFHGIEVPNAMDGVDPYTQPPIAPDETFTYEFVAKGPAIGIYHSHHNAQLQVPNGLFGAFTIGRMPLPPSLAEQGFVNVDKRMNMVLNDAGVIGLSLNGKSFPGTEPATLKVGEVMEVTYMNEGLTAHPMHLHQPVGWIIAKDGVPLEQPLPSDTVNVAPGERYTVLYKAVEPGVWAWHCHILNHAEGPDGMFGMVTALIVEGAEDT